MSDKPSSDNEYDPTSDLDNQSDSHDDSDDDLKNEANNEMRYINWAINKFFAYLFQTSN